MASERRQLKDIYCYWQGINTDVFLGKNISDYSYLNSYLNVGMKVCQTQKSREFSASKDTKMRSGPHPLYWVLLGRARAASLFGPRVCHTGPKPLTCCSSDSSLKQLALTLGTHLVLQLQSCLPTLVMCAILKVHMQVTMYHKKWQYLYCYLLAAHCTTKYVMNHRDGGGAVQKKWPSLKQFLCPQCRSWSSNPTSRELELRHAK